MLEYQYYVNHMEDETSARTDSSNIQSSNVQYNSKSSVTSISTSWTQYQNRSQSSYLLEWDVRCQYN